MPAKDDLEVENLVRSNAKLELEAEKLRKDVKVNPALPLTISALSAVAAAVGLMFSAFAQSDQAHFQVKQAEYRTKQDAIASLHSAAEMATDSKAPADRRISGVYQLRHFWALPEQEDVTAATLTAILAAGDADGYARLRCAAADGIGAAILPPRAGWAKDSIEEQNRRDRLSHLLYGVGSTGERGLVSDLNQRLRWAADHPGKEPDGSEKKVRLPSSTDDVIQCGSSIGATIEAIRQNWEQLRDVNLAATNLDYAELYEADLAYSNFINASLVGTNFKAANLIGGDFSGATGYDRKGSEAQFDHANVQGLVGKSEALCKFAVEHGAVQMSDRDWKAWRANGFPTGLPGLNTIQPPRC